MISRAEPAFYDSLHFRPTTVMTVVLVQIGSNFCFTEQIVLSFYFTDAQKEQSLSDF